MKTHLHFTFGPVQSFVAQARRTRDLYAGSLLLSHLAMSAMRGIRDARDRIILPNFTELSKLQATIEHATAPNRFVAGFDSEISAAEAGRAAEEALRTAWRKIADAVWESHLQKHVALGHGTAEIWQRQVEHFWNIAWVVGDPKTTNCLHRRKNWQTHWPPAESGDHCVLMGQWQELSGFIRSKQRKEQDVFWAGVRGGVSDLDLEEGERLCAIAFVKRFFPSVAKEAIGKEFDTKGWPSTVTIAALPWMMKIVKARPEVQEQAAAYAERVKDEPGALLSSADRIKGLTNFPNGLKTFAKLSGNFLNRTALANKKDTPLRDEARRPALLENLHELEKATDDRAGNFYAVLLMDGDSMGALIGQHGPANVTAALTEFAAKVPQVVEQHDGVTVYAGGDDLLALLPLDRALDASVVAHRLYVESFGSGIAATVSVAIVFAHYRCTFSRVLASAHDLLDDMAKDRTGRDALAIRILKPGGLAGEWSAPFKHFMKDQPHIFATLAQRFRVDKLRASLLYNLRERFTELTMDKTAARLQRDQLLPLFTAEALIGKRDQEDCAKLRVEMETMMSQVLDVCEVVRRNQETKAIEHTGTFTFDGPRLVKFLALDGKEGAE